MLHKQQSTTSQSKTTHFAPIAYATPRKYQYQRTPAPPGVPVKSIEAILLSASTQSLDGFVCTQKFMAKEYGCSVRHTSRLFSRLVSSGFIDIVWEQNYLAGLFRVFKIGKSYRHEVEAYLSNFIPQDINVAEVPTSFKTEIIDVAPALANPSGLSFALEKNAISSLDNCMYMQNKQKKPFSSKGRCAENSYGLGIVYATDYLGHFSDFNEKKRVCKMIGEVVDKKGAEFMEELFLELAREIRDYPTRRRKLTDYLARLKHE